MNALFNCVEDKGDIYGLRNCAIITWREWGGGGAGW